MKKTITLFITLLGASSVWAQSLSDAVTSCRAESNSLKRLVCYDKLAKSLDQYADMDLNAIRAARSQAAQLSDSASTGHIVINPEKEFGIERKQVAEKRLDELSASIAKVSKNPHGKLVVTLNNGQVWKQIDSLLMKLKPGQKVNIERGSFGSFLMGVEGINKTIRVKRVK